MKLLFVVHQFFPECHSGTEQYCLSIAREARRRGDDVVILSFDPYHRDADPAISIRDEPYDGFPVLRLRRLWRLSPNDVSRDHEDPLCAARFRALVRELAPDAVHFFHLRQLGSDLVRATRDVGVRSVVNLMDFWYLCPRFTLLRGDGTLCDGPPDGGLGCIPCHHPELAEAFANGTLGAAARGFARGLRAPLGGNGPAARFAAVVRRRDVQLRNLARADAVIAPSRFLARMFEQNGFAGAALRIVPYGLEPDRIVRAEVARPRAPLRLAFAGVLSPWKGVHVAVEAVRRIRGPLELTVHGRTREGMFQVYIDGVLARAAGDERIRFPGPFDRSRASSALAAADLLIVPSLWYENTPFVILEAFAAGVPVAASDLGGMREIVEPGVNGFLFPPGDVDALAALLSSLRDEPARLASLTPRPPPDIAGNYDAFRVCYAGA